MPKPPSSGGEEEEKPRGEASEDLCEMALDPELLLLRDDGEEEFGTCSGEHAGAGGGFSAGSSTLLSGPEPVWPRGPCSQLMSGFLQQGPSWRILRSGLLPRTSQRWSSLPFRTW